MSDKKNNKKPVGRKAKAEVIKGTSTDDISKAFPKNDDFDPNSPFITEPVEAKDYGKEQMDISNMPSEIPTHDIRPVSVTAEDLNNTETPQTVIHEEDDEKPASKPIASPNYGGNGGGGVADDYVEPEAPRDQNPILSTDNLSDKDKKRGAKQLVDMAFHAYRRLLSFGVGYFTIDDKELQKLSDKKKIDLRILNVQLPISSPDENGNVKTQSVLSFIQNYNEGIDEALQADEEMLEEIRPILEEKFEEQGWGISDNAKMAMLLLEITAKQIIGVFTLKSTMNSVFELGAEFLALQKSQIANDEAQRRADESRIKAEAEAKKNKPPEEGDVTIIQPEVATEKKKNNTEEIIINVDAKGATEPEEKQD